MPMWSRENSRTEREAKDTATLEEHAKESTDRELPVPARKNLDAFLAEDGATVDASARRAWAKEALKATRARAEGWRNGAAATVALVLASLALKPGEGLMQYGGLTRYALMALVAVSVGTALYAVYRLLRAANGPAWLLELPDEASADRWLARIAGARRDLQIGQRFWLASVLVFAAAVAVTWFATPAGG